jgi:hypothetical protein
LNNPRSNGACLLVGNQNLSPGHHVCEKKGHQITNTTKFHVEWLELQNIGPPELSSVWTMYFDGSKRVKVHEQES